VLSPVGWSEVGASVIESVSVGAIRYRGTVDDAAKSGEIPALSRNGDVGRSPPRWR
jgi:hypothetical protein